MSGMLSPDKLQEIAMSREEDALRILYDAFNARDADAALRLMHDDVRWPNGWEGGHVLGRDAMRDYWTRQWAEIDSHATPISFETLPDGRVTARVHLRAVGRDGALLWDGPADHVFSFDAGRIRAMEIVAAE